MTTCHDHTGYMATHTRAHTQIDTHKGMDTDYETEDTGHEEKN